MARILTPVTVRADIQPYESPVTGKWIESRAQRDEELARTGKIIAEPGWKNDVLRNREAQREKDFAPIAKGVDEVVTSLNNLGQLENLNVA